MICNFRSENKFNSHVTSGEKCVETVKTLNVKFFSFGTGFSLALDFPPVRRIVRPKSILLNLGHLVTVSFIRGIIIKGEFRSLLRQCNIDYVHRLVHFRIGFNLYYVT